MILPRIVLLCGALAALCGSALADTPVVDEGAFHIPAGQPTPPTMLCSTDFVCELEFGRGDKVFDFTAGDKVRWKISTGVSGPDGTTPTVFIEPKDTCDRDDNGKCDGPLETNLVVTTNRRTYEVFLKDVKHTPHTRYVFYDPVLDAKTRALERIVATTHQSLNADGTAIVVPTAAPTKTPHISTYELALITIEAGLLHQSKFDYNYRVVGSTPFRPSMVWNDGLHTYLKIDPHAQAVTWQAEDTRGNAYLPIVHPPIAGVYTVDGVPPHLWLIQDVGKKVPQIDVYLGDKS
jgi:type IV secretion system protein VirB9